MTLLHLALAEIKRLHRDDSGAPEASTVLIMALIGIPLILLLIAFGKQIGQMLIDIYNDMSGHKGDVPKSL